MKTGIFRFGFAWLVSIALGCTSAPIRYYTLTPPAQDTLPVSKTSIAIDLRVHVPPQLRRSELIVRTGPTEVALLENERWASPVNDEIEDALRFELQRRLARTPGLTLDIDVQHLEAELGRYALLEASWSATLSAEDPASAGARTVTCAFRTEEQIRVGLKGMVEGYQREVGTLAETIVATLNGLTSGAKARCQESISDH